MLHKKWPHKSIQLVSNIVDVPGSKTPFALRRDYLFIGGFQHRPNIDAVLFFVQEIYPLVSDRLRDAKFYIIGDKAPPEIVALATERVIVAGLQRDVRPFFDSVKAICCATAIWGGRERQDQSKHGAWSASGCNLHRRRGNGTSGPSGRFSLPTSRRTLRGH